MSVFQYVVLLIGIAMSFGYYPQAYKMYRNHSAENVSPTAMLIFALGTTLWTLYCFVNQDLTIILSFAFGMVGSWLILIFIFLYHE
ncbi:MAG: hypothetical protein HY817_03790 [Candidatus Abawacabacteria bacterium]|nr:hypothetical protein [Candidatus Abawacabacteria bacterium]